MEFGVIGDKFIYRDFTGMYYAGFSTGWANLGGSSWTKKKENAKLLTRDEAERMKKHISGEIIKHG